MKTRVQKWGNSLALRIPKVLAERAGLAENSSVELSLQQGELVVRRAVAQRISLKRLLRGITDKNLHGEINTGQPVWREVW